MKRIPALLAALLFLALPACTKAPELTAPSVPEPQVTFMPTPEPEIIEIVVWEEPGNAAEFIRRAGALFNETIPGVSVRVAEVEPDRAVSKFMEEAPQGSGPDLFAPTWPRGDMAALASGGHIAAAVAEGGIRARIHKACGEALTYDGVLYGYPLSAETYALYYNKALVAESEVPRTWDELTAFCEEFDAAEAGFVMDAGDPYQSITFTSANGNRVFGPEGVEAQNIASDAAVSGMTVLAGLGKTAGAAQLAGERAMSMFKEGAAAMYIADSSALAGLEGVDFGVAPMPALPGDDTPAATLSDTRCLFISAYSKHVVVASVFCEFLLTDEMQRLRVEMCGGLPAADVSIDRRYDGFIAQLAYAYPMPYAGETEAFMKEIGAAALQIWNGADVKEALDGVRVKSAG
ncbi:MAG: extracellular solute-binding protein [Oscillospiraceae bacterium]|nr:extracellular solute-binding protein [Oscillospiraceae bacterium]